jgi:hypothetical protein
MKPEPLIMLLTQYAALLGTNRGGDAVRRAGRKSQVGYV